MSPSTLSQKEFLLYPSGGLGTCDLRGPVSEPQLLKRPHSAAARRSSVPVVVTI